MEKNTFPEAFNEFIWSRTDEADAFLLKDPEYQEVYDSLTALEDKIQNTLGPEGLELVDKLVTLNGLISALEKKFSYKQGLKDGIELHGKLRLQF